MGGFCKSFLEVKGKRLIMQGSKKTVDFFVQNREKEGEVFIYAKC